MVFIIQFALCMMQNAAGKGCWQAARGCLGVLRRRVPSAMGQPRVQHLCGNGFAICS